MNLENINDDIHIRKYAGRRIKEFRLAKGLSQENLAKAIHYETSQAIAHLENGDRGIKVEVLAKIAAILDTSIDEFFPNSKTTPSTNSFAFKMRSEKNDKEVEKSLNDFAALARKKFGKKN